MNRTQIAINSKVFGSEQNKRSTMIDNISNGYLCLRDSGLRFNELHLRNSKVSNINTVHKKNLAVLLK